MAQLPVMSSLPPTFAVDITSLSARYRDLLQASRAKLHRLSEQWAQLKAQYAEKTDTSIAHVRDALAEIRREVQLAMDLLELAGAPARI